MNFTNDKPIVTITEAAANQAKKLIDNADSDVIGLRIVIKTAGCSGLQYQVEYAKEVKNFEEKIVDKGISIFIDPSAVMFLIGSEMDYKVEKFSSTFVFNNPNETARCGCGESFSVS